MNRKIVKKALAVVFHANIFAFTALGLLNLITFVNPKIFKKTKSFCLILILSNVNSYLLDYKLGALYAARSGHYIEIYDQIKSLEVGLSQKIIAKINAYTRIMNCINCLILLEPNRSFWKKVKINRLLSHQIVYIKSGIDDIGSQLIGEINEDILTYLAGGMYKGGNL